MSRPASAPRRWPDLLIGLLVLLLLGGFGALLLKPPRSSTSATTQSPGTQANIPAAPAQTAQAPAEASPTTPAATAPTTETPTTQATPPASAPPEATTEPAQPEAPVIAAAPIQPTQAEAPATTPPPPSAASQQGTSTQTESQAPTAPATDQPATTATTPRSGGAVTTSAQRTPLRSDYRVSLGVFATARTVRTQTAAVSGLGYTVYPIDIGGQYVAQVGPFANEADAQQALADIRRAYPSAVMYPPRGTTSTSGSTTSSSTSTSTQNNPSPAPASNPNGPTYLQVGAFDRVESAQALVQKLRDLGYVPTVNAPEGRKVTVMVGPYTGDALGRTESRLSANGLDHFRVR